MPQCVQNTFKNDLKMAANGQYHAAYIGVGNQVKCASQMVTFQLRLIAACYRLIVG